LKRKGKVNVTGSREPGKPTLAFNEEKKKKGGKKKRPHRRGINGNQKNGKLMGEKKGGFFGRRKQRAMPGSFD